MLKRWIVALALATALGACERNQEGSGVMAEIQRQEAERAQEGAAAIQAGAALLAENAKKAGVTVTESGLQYEVVRAASDESLARPGATDEVTVHYEGTRVDGSVFDSSYSRGEPASFPLDGVIPGWTEGLQLMRPGEEFRFVIPPELAYGDGGPAPGQPLIFKVELLSFRNARGQIVQAPR